MNYLCYISGCNSHIGDDLKVRCKSDIDMEKLKLHLPDVIKSVWHSNQEVTQISTICDVFNHQPALKSFITEVHKLLKLYLTIPVNVTFLD